MNREVHVRFWEGVEVKFSCATQLSGGLSPASRQHEEKSVWRIADSVWHKESEADERVLRKLRPVSRPSESPAC